MKNGADVLVECLTQRGVSHLFGMPGSHSTTIYDAIARRPGSIDTVLFRNEQAGAFAADGYARVTGRPGVVCTTAGPGATNALTGVAECWADSVPILLVSGQVNAATLDRECGNYHEIDLERIFQPATKWCGTVRHVDEIAGHVARAFQAMTTGRPRPAALFLPQDLMRATCPDCDVFALTFRRPRRQVFRWMRLPKPPSFSPARRRPIILAGGGALWSGAATATSKPWPPGLAHRCSRRSTARACSTNATRSRSGTLARRARDACCRTPMSCSRWAADSRKS